MKDCCPFCRESLPASQKEYIKRFEKRMNANDADAFIEMGFAYKLGRMGLPQNLKLSYELFTSASELGSANGHRALYLAYYYGQEGYDKDIQKAMYHMKLAAMGGNEQACCDLGIVEIEQGNVNQAIKHFMIAAKSGQDTALKIIGEAYKDEQVTKDEYSMALRSYQSSRDEMKSDQRKRALPYASVTHSK